MHISNIIVKSTVENLLACELRTLGVAVAEDPDIRDTILKSSAESIIQGVSANVSMLEIVNEIQDYIKNTRTNYPSYFLTGETRHVLADFFK